MAGLTNLLVKMNSAQKTTHSTQTKRSKKVMLTLSIPVQPVVTCLSCSLGKHKVDFDVFPSH